jgi:hypothetical protein
MHAVDILRYGHATVMGALDGLPGDAWEAPAVVGVWSARHVVAHLASFERVLTEVLASTLDPAAPTPTLALMGRPGFNDEQVAARGHLGAAETLAEYEALAAQSLGLARRVPAGEFSRAGALPWYGAEYDLDDFLVYTFYGHKREHAAQLALHRRRVLGAATP